MSPASSTRVARRASESRSSPSNPMTSGSSGISSASRRARRTASAQHSARTCSGPDVALWPSVNSRCTVASTAGSRSDSSWAAGVVNAVPTWARRRLARTRRWAIVASGIRNSRATAAVDSPHNVRRASATRASIDSTGSQHMNTSASTSSRTTLSLGSFQPSSEARLRWAAICLSIRLASRRRRSNALLRAIVVIHAPGRSGTPSIGQRSSATTKASCTASSAASRLPRRRVRVARAFRASARNAASRARSLSPRR